MKQSGLGVRAVERIRVVVIADGPPEKLEKTLKALANQEQAASLSVLLWNSKSSPEVNKLGESCLENFAELRIAGPESSLPPSEFVMSGRRSLPAYFAFLRAGDVLLPEALSLLLEAKPAADIVVGAMERPSHDSELAWLQGKFLAGGMTSVEESPRLLSTTSYSGKLFKTDYIRGLLSLLDRVDDAALVRLTYLAMLGARKIWVVNQPVCEEAASITDEAVREPVSNWFTPIELAELGYSRWHYLSFKQRRAVEYHFVRENMHRLLSSPLTLDDVSLQNYFQRAQAVARNCSLSRIAGIASSLRLRTAFYALLADDYDLFKDPRANIQTLTVDSGNIYLQPRNEFQDSLKLLLEVKSPRAYAEHSFVSGGKVVVSGRVAIPGTFGADLVGVRVRIATQGRGLGDFVSLTVRHPLPANHSMGLYEWVAEVSPWKGFAESPLDFRLEAPDGGFTVRLRYTLGFSRTSRPLRTVAGTTQLFPSDEQRLTLTHLASDKVKRSGGAWKKMMLKKDLRAARNRRPLSRWRIIRLLTLFLRRRNYWLIGERSDTAQDSGYIFFDWLRSEKKEIRPRYVLRKDSEAWKRAASRKGLVPHGGLRHKLILLHAKVLASTQDIDSYMLPDSWNRVSFRNELSPRLSQRRVFLQHGVTHNGVGPQLHRGVTGLDLLVCASPQEASYLQETTGYGTELVAAGFPRFDRLYEARQKPKSRRVLLMPTWRRYLVAPSYSEHAIDPGNFVGSKYERFFSELLGDEHLHALLEKNDLMIDFVPHYETAAYFSNEEIHPRVNIITDGGSQLPDLLATTPLLITDYSSVMFDVAYAGGLVMQVLFDYDDFYSRHYQPGWYDPRNGGLGATTSTVKETVDALFAMVESGFTQDELYAQRLKGYFSHHDSGARARVFEAIAHAL